MPKGRLRPARGRYASLRDDRWSVDGYPGVLAFQKNQLYVTEEDECLFLQQNRALYLKSTAFTRDRGTLCANLEENISF